MIAPNQEFLNSEDEIMEQRKVLPSADSPQNELSRFRDSGLGAMDSGNFGSQASPQRASQESHKLSQIQENGISTSDPNSANSFKSASRRESQESQALSPVAENGTVSPDAKSGDSTARKSAAGSRRRESRNSQPRNSIKENGIASPANSVHSAAASRRESKESHASLQQNGALNSGRYSVNSNESESDAKANQSEPEEKDQSEPAVEQDDQSSPSSHGIVKKYSMDVNPQTEIDYFHFDDSRTPKTISRSESVVSQGKPRSERLESEKQMEEIAEAGESESRLGAEGSEGQNSHRDYSDDDQAEAETARNSIQADSPAEMTDDLDVRKISEHSIKSHQFSRRDSESQTVANDVGSPHEPASSEKAFSPSPVASPAQEPPSSGRDNSGHSEHEEVSHSPPHSPGEEPDERPSTHSPAEQEPEPEPEPESSHSPVQSIANDEFSQSVKYNGSASPTATPSPQFNHSPKLSETDGDHLTPARQHSEEEPEPEAEPEPEPEPEQELQPSFLSLSQPEPKTPTPTPRVDESAVALESLGSVDAPAIADSIEITPSSSNKASEELPPMHDLGAGDDEPAEQFPVKKKRKKRANKRRKSADPETGEPRAARGRSQRRTVSVPPRGKSEEPQPKQRVDLHAIFGRSESALARRNRRLERRSLKEQQAQEQERLSAEQKRQQAEAAYKAWLEKKEEERKRAKSVDREQSRTSSQLALEQKAQRQAEAEAAFRAWCSQKKNNYFRRDGTLKNYRFSPSQTWCNPLNPNAHSKEDVDQAFESWKERKRIQLRKEKQEIEKRRIELEQVLSRHSASTPNLTTMKHSNGPVDKKRLPKIMNDSNVRRVSPARPMRNKVLKNGPVP